MGGMAPAVTFTLTPTLLDANSHLFTLNVNGQVTRYDHGPRNATNFSWPGQGANQVYFEFSPTPAGGGRLSRVGPWAWFRVLDETGGLKRGSAQESFIARFELADRYAEYELGAGSAFNPFDMDELRTFRCPNRL